MLEPSDWRGRFPQLFLAGGDMGLAVAKRASMRLSSSPSDSRAAARGLSRGREPTVVGIDPASWQPRSGGTVVREGVSPLRG